jgi:beta-lactamase superfamily II metal-dependent hydrolase
MRKGIRWLSLIISLSAAGAFSAIGVATAEKPAGLEAIATSSAEISFGTTKGSSTTYALEDTDFTATGITVTSFTPTYVYSYGSGYAARFGNGSGTAKLVLKFDATVITGVTLNAAKYGSDTNTVKVATSAHTSYVSNSLTSTSYKDYVYDGLDGGTGKASTSLTITCTSRKRFYLSDIVFTLGTTEETSSSSSEATSSQATTTSSSSHSSSSSSATSSSHSTTTSSTPTSTSSSSTSTSSGSYMYTKQSGDALKVFAIEQTGTYGDCTLIKYGNFEILVDGGNVSSQAQLGKYLSQYVTDHCVEIVVCTHPHTDHYGGFYSSSVSNIMLTNGGVTSVKYIVDSGADAYGSTYKNKWVNGVRSYYVGKGAKYYAIENLVSGHMYDAIWNITADISLQWLDTGYYCAAGASGDTTDANNNSVAFNLRAGTYDYVLMGDLPSTPEEKLATNYASHKFWKTGDKIVFKACHHCSKTANSATFLSFLQPNYAWASAGITSSSSTTSGPTSQHPYVAPRQRIETYTGVANMWWNGTAGTLDIFLNASFTSLSITGEGRQYGKYYSGGTLVSASSEQNLPVESTKWAAAGY